MKNPDKSDIIEKFRRVIQDGSMVKCPQARTPELEALISERARILGATSLDHYLEIVSADVFELENLVGRLTTKETYFFRIPGQFEALRKNIFPNIEERLGGKMCSEGALGGRGKRERIRIWSAGCATGEEPYSIAMALLEGIRYKRAWDVEILGTDISRDALMTARSGIYGGRSLNGFPEIYANYINRFQGGFSVTDEVKKLATFGLFNLNKLSLDPLTPGVIYDLDGRPSPFLPEAEFDVIFFRNVLIYFDVEAQQGLIDKLFRCLKPGGYLFTGDVEQLYIYKHKFISMEMDGAVFYRRPEK